MLLALAWRNLWRRPQRTVLSLISIGLVSGLLVFVLSFQDGVYGQMKETTLRIFDGYAQFQPVGYANDPRLELTISDPARLAQQAVLVQGVTAAAPRVNGFAILANGGRSYAAAVIGVDPASEAKISTIADRISAGRYLMPADTDGAVLGDILAKNLGVGVGDKVTLLGQARDGSVAADVLRVTGIYHSGIADLDRTILEMPFARAQATFGMEGEANTVALAGPSLGGVDAALPKLAEVARAQGLALRDWQAMEPAMRDTIDLKYATSMVFYVSLVLVVAFIILNTLLMSVLERTREFGMLLALGMRSRQVGTMVWIELLILAIGGCVVGVAIGAVVTAYFQHTGIVYPIDPKLLAQFGVPRRLVPSLTWFSAMTGPAALLTAVLVGGLVPYVRVSRLTPAIAMRGA
ncbi:MAG TPA: FtsX-like permease family protein [Caulobacteraceae bacterium]|jgi:ABC-type lipoprotein release transport system permease subunit